MASVLLKQAAAANRILDCVNLYVVAIAALEHCRAVDDALGIAEALYYLGTSALMLAGADNALLMFRVSLEIRHTHGDDVGAAQCLVRMGNTHRGMNQMQEALSTIGEAVELASRTGDRLGLAAALQVLGVTHLELSNFVEAANAFSEAITISRNIGSVGELASSLRYMGLLKTKLGNYIEAEERLKESISISRRISDLWGIAEGRHLLGECFRQQSKLDDAASALVESCLAWQQQSQHKNWELAASSLVEVKGSQGDWNGALFWHDHIITVCRNRKEFSKVADYLEKKSQILVRVQQYDEAALHLEAAVMIYKENESSYARKRNKLCAIPKTFMNWERRLPLLCDMKKLQRRLPQLVTAGLKLPFPAAPGVL